ncbi:MAG: hypothetical protein LBR66_04065 [Candidatus Symbiothrix sp.]|jgi:hypothetical protein|nr:hypothetical protein [Candidatus Symbiothrix sp.]
MARTISEIKAEMTAQFVADATVKEEYGLTEGATFDANFTPTTLESILFYCVAFGVWVMEKLYDEMRSDVSTYFRAMRPYTIDWYAEHSREFSEYIVDLWVFASAERNGAVRLEVGMLQGGEIVPLDDSADLADFTAWWETQKVAGVQLDIYNWTGELV